MSDDAPMWPLRGRRDRSTLLAFVAGIVVLLAVVGALLGPATSTETRYAVMGREMLESGDWIVPTLNGAPLLEKPPFEYWVNAACFAVFGATDLTARFPSLLAGVLTLLVVARLARRFAPATDTPDDRAARGPLAVLALATMPAFWIQAMTISTDIWLVLVTTIAGGALLESVRADGKPGLRATLLLHGAFGVGMLVKGPLTLALVGLAALGTSIARRDLRPMRPFVHPLGLLLFAAITVPWYVAVDARIPGLLRDFISRRLFGGVGSSADFHSHSMWVVWLPLLGAFPWLATLPHAVAVKVREKTLRQGVLLPGLLLAFAAPVLFSFSKSRLVSYASPAFPWLAFVAAIGWPLGAGAGDATSGRRRELARATIGAGLFALGFVVSTVVKGGATTPTIVAGVAAVVAFGVALGCGLFGRTPTLFPRIAATAAALVATMGACALATPERIPATKPLWQAIERVRTPGDELGAVMPYTGDWGLLPWYAGGPVRFFDYPSKPMMVPPEVYEPDRFLPKSALRTWFEAPKRRFLLIRRRDLGRKDYLADAPTYRVAEQGIYVVLTNLPLPAGA